MSEKSPTEYWKAPEVEAVAKKLIATAHRRLNDVRIDYYFRSDTPVSKGKYLTAITKKVTTLTSEMANNNGEPFFCIVVAEPAWKLISEKQREAVIDHELCHCEVKTIEGEIKLKLLPHDLQEFNAVVRRHGAYDEDLQKFLQAAHESTLPTLFDDKEEEDKEAA